MRRPALAVALGLAGGVVGVLVAAAVHVPVGPFDATFSARPSWNGDTVVRLGPLGTLRLDTHSAPFVLDVRVDDLRLDEAERIVRDPGALDDVEDELAADARRGLRALASRALLVAAVGGGLACLVRHPRLRLALVGTGAGALLVLGSLAGAAVTWRSTALGEPRYSGLLAVAPRAVGDVERITRRFSEYRAQLAALVGNVAALYQTAEALPTLDAPERLTTVLHVSDIHLNPQAFDLVREVVAEFGVDAIVDTGDLTDWGTEPESQLVDRIGQLAVPYVWVRGNHDSEGTQAAVAAQPNAVVLDGTSHLVAGLRFWGIGDPRYTPDKSQPLSKDDEREQADAFASELATRLLAGRVAGLPVVDVAVTHDPRTAADLPGAVPLVLAGHTHRPRETTRKGTVLLVQGSTGGAGLRALDDGEPEPLTCAVLYFDPATRRLRAYDQITVAGLGRTEARIERHVLE